MLDGLMIMLGSMNATSNSVTRCEELGVFIRTIREVEQMKAHFYHLWYYDSCQIPDECLGQFSSKPGASAVGR